MTSDPWIKRYRHVSCLHQSFGLMSSSIFQPIVVMTNARHTLLQYVNGYSYWRVTLDRHTSQRQLAMTGQGLDHVPVTVKLCVLAICDRS